MFKLFSNCFLIKGNSQSVIYDSQRSKYFFVPNDLYFLIKNYQGKSICDIKKAYDNKYNETIEDYIKFLIKNELGFISKDIANFPNMTLDFVTPSVITNAIITEQKNYRNYNIINSFFNQLNCKSAQFRFFYIKSYREIDNILKIFSESTLQHIEIIMPNNKKITKKSFKNLFYKHQRLWDIKLYKCRKNKILFIDKQKQHPVYYTAENIIDHSFCGNIYPNNFVNNITFFTESINYNTCLNRKLCIDENGYIKNCPSMSKHYGHISNTNVAEVVQSTEFQKLWHIKKDDIKVCKDCEFRHMCMDCRAYIKNPNDIYSQPAKCPYNPYIAKWQGQESYITVEQWQKENPNWEQQAKEQRQTTY